ncbi:hypothetical protein GCM10028820_13490 [Tessaracoccus terricola]
MEPGIYSPDPQPAGQRPHVPPRQAKPLSRKSKIALTVFASILALLVVRGGWVLAVGLAGVVLVPTGFWQLLSGRSWIPAVFRSRRTHGRKAGAVVALAGVAMAGFTNLLMDPTDTGREAAAEPSVSATPTLTPSPTPEPTPEPTPTPSPSPSPEPSPTPSPSTLSGSALAVLGTLEVKGRAPKTGYDRAQFGQRWADVDRNGCDTRNDILARDLTEKTFKPGTRDCVVLTGTLADPFTATLIPFVRGETTSNDVQIDHVVALSDAWQKGAQQLSLETRTAFANDPLNLLAVDGPTNQQKGDGDAATWLPPNKSFRCDYVARQVAVKAKYQLWVTVAESDAIIRVLTDCMDQTVPGDDDATVAPSVTVTTASPNPPTSTTRTATPSAPPVPTPSTWASPATPSTSTATALTAGET